MKSIEASGKTVEDALKSGLQELGCDLSQVTHEVIDRGSPGLFGMFGRLARVRITVNEEEKELDFDMPKLTLAPEKPKEAPRKKEKKEAPKPAEKAVVNEEPAPAVQTPAEEAAAEDASAAAPAVKPAKSRRSRKPKKDRVSAEAPVQEVPVQETVAEAPARVFPPLDVNALSEDGKKAYAFLADITRLMEVDVEIRMLEEENQIFADITGDTLGVLIGRRGDTLDAIQYLTSLTVNKDKNDYTRVTIDVEHYRAKREETLRKLANRMANRARKTGRRVVLEPMNPYERRVLHSALQDNPYVQTHSEGEEPYRRVIITLK